MPVASTTDQLLHPNWRLMCWWNEAEGEGGVAFHGKYTTVDHSAIWVWQLVKIGIRSAHACSSFFSDLFATLRG